MKPIIGIVPRTDTVNNNYRLQINYNYLNQFLKRGVIPLILPFNEPEIETLLKQCDGFLIPGGVDMDPKYYNQTNEGDSKDVDAYIDDLDDVVIKYAVRNKVPMFGICRGIQSIAAIMGGTLYQDIAKANLKNDEVDHRHFVTTLYNHPFAKNFKPSFETNSYHHQAVDKVPEGFEVIFKHNEIIEGIIHNTLPITAVQWHPERFDAPESDILFDYFVNQIKEYHNEK